jgi:hypothetical protein
MWWLNLMPTCLPACLPALLQAGPPRTAGAAAWMGRRGPKVPAPAPLPARPCSPACLLAPACLLLPAPTCLLLPACPCPPAPARLLPAATRPPSFASPFCPSPHPTSHHSTHNPPYTSLLAPAAACTTMTLITSWQRGGRRCGRTNSTRRRPTRPPGARPRRASLRPPSAWGTERHGGVGMA